jgi:hypothetical protein
MTAPEHTRLRHVPRVHAALVVAGDDHAHAAAPETDHEALCGASGSIARHLFEDAPRRETCPLCQARCDAVRAADLLGAIAGAANRGQLHLAPEILKAAQLVDDALSATYPADSSRPDFDVRH